MSGDYLRTRMENSHINDKIVKRQDLKVFLNANEFHSALEELDK